MNEPDLRHRPLIPSTLKIPLRFRVVLLIILFMPLIAAADSGRTAISAGVMTSLDYAPSLVGSAEYRFGYSLLPDAAKLRPMIGLLGTNEGGLYGYGGLRLSFPVSTRWRWENALGLGGYRSGGGPDLYQTFEFCLAVSLLVDVSKTSSAGVQLFHISNAGLANKDPGANSFVAVFEFQ